MDIINQKPHNSAFSLVELLTIVAIIAILAAFAIPSYMHNITETKVNSMWQQAEAAKLAVQSKFLKSNVDVTTINIDSGAAEYTTTNIDFIKCVTIQSGIISVVGKANSFSSKNIWIAWTPSVATGLLTWTCSYSDDAAEYLSYSTFDCSAGTSAFAGDAACN